MIRTQIQLPDHIYQEAKAFCRDREMSLAELCRRSLEEYLARWPPPGHPVDRDWAFPAYDLGDFLAADSEWRTLANEGDPG